MKKMPNYTSLVPFTTKKSSKYDFKSLNVGEYCRFEPADNMTEQKVRALVSTQHTRFKSQNINVVLQGGHIDGALGITRIS